MKKNMIPKMIQRKNYPELNLILWDRVDTSLPAQDAFKYYERRWRYIDERQLTDKERDLIKDLALKYGNGLLLTA